MRRFQFRVRTLLVLMLVFGAGGGMWMRHAYLRNRQIRQQIELAEKLQPIMDRQLRVGSKILDRFPAKSGVAPVTGATHFRTGSSRGFSLSQGLHWDMTLHFATDTATLIRIDVGSVITQEGPGVILIQASSIQQYEEVVQRCVDELQDAFEENGWQSEQVSVER